MINGQAATQLSSSHQYITTNLSEFIDIFKKYENKKEKKNEYTNIHNYLN